MKNMQISQNTQIMQNMKNMQIIQNTQIMQNMYIMQNMQGRGCAGWAGYLCLELLSTQLLFYKATVAEYRELHLISQYCNDIV